VQQQAEQSRDRDGHEKGQEVSQDIPSRLGKNLVSDQYDAGTAGVRAKRQAKSLIRGMPNQKYTTVTATGAMAWLRWR
jgi:hypothetical protein